MFTSASRISDADFNRLALDNFRFQFDRNAPYAAYCRKRKRTPDNVASWQDIPAVPTAAFKEVDLVAGDKTEAEAVFQTSGTTRGSEKRGRHYVLDTALYRQSLLAGFKQFVMPDHERMRMVSLMPSLADSSLSFMIDTIMAELGSENSESVATVERGVDRDRLHRIMFDTNEPLCFLGTSLAYLHWLENANESYRLPAGSRLMDTGGFKGEKREIAPAELRGWYRDRLGIESCYNEYGMTELCSQYYSAADDIKRGPPWLRFRVLDPDTLNEVPAGETGILQHVDLANRNSVSAVLTEDLAFASDDGFVLLGRAPGAMPRGCSIAMDILLSGAR